MAEQGVEYFRGLYEAFGRGDIPTVLESFDPDIEWYEMEGNVISGHFHGPQEVLQNVFARIGDILGPEFKIVPTDFIISGEKAVVVLDYHIQGKNDHQMHIVPYVHYWQLKNGKSTRFASFGDSATTRKIRGV